MTDHSLTDLSKPEPLSSRDLIRTACSDSTVLVEDKMCASPWERVLSRLTEVRRTHVLFITIKSQQIHLYLEYMKLT